MKKFSKTIKIGNSIIGGNRPTYFIADIAANHDGNLQRAKDLIYLAAESGADAAKFQHFTAATIVSHRGFETLTGIKSHQSKWDKSVYDVYDKASLDNDWTFELKKTCDNAGIDFFTSPYSIELIESVDQYVSAYKIGSGDITYLEIIRQIASKNKPVLIAAGASSINDIIVAVDELARQTSDICLMQCNTNYTASLENFKYINLNVLKTFAILYPGMILGLSDHTPGHSTVLGAMALGARVIEKHFTDDNGREGPDHRFAMDPTSWKNMVDRSRELENALGEGLKKVEENELETVVVQRRAIRAKSELQKGHIIQEGDIICLRPCPQEALSPMNVEKIIGKEARSIIRRDDMIRWSDLN